MKRDLTDLLREWPFKAGQINARVIQGDDGEPKVQVRLDLGIIQMNMSGRPDGRRPRGYDSLLEYFEAKLDRFQRGEIFEDDESENEDETTQTGDSAESPEKGNPEPADSATPAGGKPVEESPTEPDENPIAAQASAEEDDEESSDVDDSEDLTEGSGEGSGEAPADGSAPDRFSLTPEDCRLLREEAVQYYHRYIALLVLEDFEGVVRDTTRNLRVLDLCTQHAQTESDRNVLEQFRPYITMMRARAMASQAIKDDEPKAAVHALDEALEALQMYFSERGQPQAFDQSSEVEALRGMRDALVPKLPVSQKAELRARLQKAIDQENYELAAILRDELRQLQE